MINVPDFLANAAKSKNYARPNLFNVEIFPPEGLRVDNATLQSIGMNCKQSQFPGKTNEVQPFIGGGYIARPTVFATSYAPLGMTFYLSGDHKEKIFFEEWMNMAYNENTNTLNYYDEYVGTMIVSQLNRRMQTMKSVQLFECQPLSVIEVEVASDAENAVAELGVVMGFRNYRYLK